MSDGTERREARRFTMSLPLRVMPHKEHHPEFTSRTRDVSYRGLYFTGETDWEVGHEIDFVLTLPKVAQHAGEVEIRCHGKVLRVDHSENGHNGIAAKIDRYEFIPAAASAA